LKRLWSIHIAVDDGLGSIVPAGRMAELDPFDRVQLAHVVNTCRRSRSLSEAGRMLFAASLAKRTSSNDADRLRKYLQRFDLTWQDLHESL
jgi:transcriptional regulatory protein RtcR